MNGDFLEHYFTNNKDLKSEFRILTYEIKQKTFTFISDNGVFSKNKIDFGSQLLVETFLKQNTKKITTVLDVGCGYGFIGIVLSALLPAHVTFIDVNKRALHLTEKNCKENKVSAEVLFSDIYENIQKSYDLIITNPPIRAGKKVVYEILQKAKEHLNADGELWFVIRREQGAKSALRDLGAIYTIDVIKKEHGFYIFRAKTS